MSRRLHSTCCVPLEGQVMLFSHHCGRATISTSELKVIMILIQFWGFFFPIIKVQAHPHNKTRIALKSWGMRVYTVQLYLWMVGNYNSSNRPHHLWPECAISRVFTISSIFNLHHSTGSKSYSLWHESSTFLFDPR